MTLHTVTHSRCTHAHMYEHSNMACKSSAYVRRHHDEAASSAMTTREYMAQASTTIFCASFLDRCSSAAGSSWAALANRAEPHFARASSELGVRSKYTPLIGTKC